MYNMDERCWVSSYEQMLLQSRPPRLLQLLQQYLYRLHHLHFLGEKNTMSVVPETQVKGQMKGKDDT